MELAVGNIVDTVLAGEVPTSSELPILRKKRRLRNENAIDTFHRWTLRTHRLSTSFRYLFRVCILTTPSHPQMLSQSETRFVKLYVNVGVTKQDTHESIVM